MNLQERINRPVNISTKRTAVNVGGAMVAVAVWNKLTPWDIEISEDDWAILAPVLAVGVGFYYRVSRAITDWKPKLGYILFGSALEPTGVSPIEDNKNDA